MGVVSALDEQGAAGLSGAAQAQQRAAGGAAECMHAALLKETAAAGMVNESTDMETAEDERLQQQPLVADDSADFSAAIGGPKQEQPAKPAPVQKPLLQHNAPVLQHNAPLLPYPYTGAAANAGGGGAVPANAHAAAPAKPAPHAHPHQPGHPTLAHARPVPTHSHPPHGAAHGSGPIRNVSAAASPSASSSPHAGHSLAIPYAHTAPLFKDKVPYLAPNASPSQRDGLNSEDEFLLRAHTCVFMGTMVQRLKLGQLALATASVFLQVFFTHYSFKAFDRMEIACTCLFLAGKVEERRVRVDHVLGAYFADKEAEDRKLAAAAGRKYEPRPKALLDSPEWDALRTRVYEYEALLLDAIEYNFEIFHPYSYLRKFLEKYIYSAVYCEESDEFIKRHLGGAGGLAQTAWNFINDSLRTSLCLRYAPSVICVSAIRLAMRHLITVTKVLDAEPVRKLPNGQPAPPATPGAKVKLWYEELFAVDRKTDKAISGEIMSVLELLQDKDKTLDARVLAVHRKCKEGRSTVPLPCARTTHELIAGIQAKQREQQRQQQQQQQQAQRGASASAAAAAGPAASNSQASSGAGAARPAAQDRKRARSPAKQDSSRRDGADSSRSSHSGRHPHRSPRPGHRSYSPLSSPPSPFLDAHERKTWVPDLRRDHHRHSGGGGGADRTEPHKREGQHRGQHEREREQQRSHGQQAPTRTDSAASASAAAASAPNSAGKSPRDRPRSKERRSYRRSNSRDAGRARMADVADEGASAAVAAAASFVAPSSSPPEEGEVREGEVKLDTIREEGELALPAATVGGQLLMTPNALLASPSTGGVLTKSCSSLTLSALSMNPPHPASSRLHSSVSMVNLSAINGATAAASAVPDILAGDILRMSTAHSPSSSDATGGLHASLSGGVPVVVNEDDIMREISRGTNELRDDAEEQSMAEGERMPKRARTGAPTTHTSPDDAAGRTAAGEFEPGSLSVHSASHLSQPAVSMETSHVSTSGALEHADSTSTLVTEMLPATQTATAAGTDTMSDAHAQSVISTDGKPVCEEGQRCSPEAHVHDGMPLPTANGHTEPHAQAMPAADEPSGVAVQMELAH